MNDPIDAMQHRLLERHQSIKQLFAEKRQLLDAFREAQLEQGQMLEDHGQRLDRLERKVDDGFRMFDTNFERVDANFRAMGTSASPPRAEHVHPHHPPAVACGQRFACPPRHHRGWTHDKPR